MLRTFFNIQIVAKMGEIPSPSGQGVDASMLAERIKTLTLPVRTLSLFICFSFSC